MTAAIVVRLAFVDRPAALPLAFASIRKGNGEDSRLTAARRLVESLAIALPGRNLHVVERHRQPKRRRRSASVDFALSFKLCW